MEERRLKKAKILSTNPLTYEIPSEFLTPECFHPDLRLEGNKLKCPHCKAEIEAVRMVGSKVNHDDE